MDFLKKILNLSSILFGLFLLLYLGGIVYWLYEKIRYKTTAPPPVNPFGALKHLTGENATTFVLAVVILLAGAANEIARPIFKKNEIGAFYEPADYEQAYEAYIYPYDNSYDAIFCIVDLWKHTDEYSIPDGESERLEFETNYTIVAINFPYGQTIYTDSPYYPNSSKNKVNLSWDDYRIQLVRPATELSYEQLNNSVASSGGFCASRNSEIFHRASCRYADSIKSSNKIFFDSSREAELFCFEPCDTCEPFS